MRKTDLKGGQDEYRISEILGQNFQIFTSLLEADKELTGFRVGALQGSYANEPPNTTKTDLHYSFMEELMAIAAAFRYIETPIFQKAEIAGEYGNIITSFIVRLANNDYKNMPYPLPTKRFEYEQLPYRYGKKFQYPYLSNVAHLFSYYGNTSNNSLLNVFDYLYHLISLFDTLKLNARDVINLARNDQINFMVHVRNLADIIIDYGGLNFPHNSDQIILDGVLGGLTDVAQLIINNLNSSSAYKATPQTGFDVTGIDFENNDPTIFIDWLKAQGVNQDIALSIIEKFVELRLFKQGDKAKDVVTSVNEITNYQKNAYLNPYYMTDTVFKNSIDEKEYTSIPQVGGKRKNNYNQVGAKLSTIDYNGYPKAGTVQSLGFLYGIKTDAGKYNLVSIGNQGKELHDAEFVQPKTSVDLVYRSVRFVRLGEEEEEPSKNMPIINLLSKLKLNSTQDTDKLKVALFTIYYYMIENNKKKFTDIKNSERPTIQALIDKEYSNYLQFLINTNQKSPIDASIIDNLSKKFASGFVLNTYRLLSRDPSSQQLIPATQTQPGVAPIQSGVAPIQSAVAQQTNTKATNFNNPAIINFFRNVISPEPGFYSRFFNLVKIHPTGGEPQMIDVPLDNAVITLDDTQLLGYRLNVRKVAGYSILTQIGGIGQFGEVLYVTLIPEYSTQLQQSIQDNIWMSPSQKADPTLVRQKGLDALKFPFRAIYNKDVNAKTIPIYNVTIDLPVLAQRVVNFQYFGKVTSSQNYYKDILRKALQNSSTVPGLTSKWKEGEIQINDHMLKQSSTWERDGDLFRRKNDQGEFIDEPFPDSCSFISNVQDCVSFFTQCLSSSSPDGTLPPQCGTLIDMNFNFSSSPDVGTLTKEIIKINPAIAFNILQKFGFGRIQETEEKPVNGIHLYKAQSVGSWLDEIFAESDICANPQVQRTKDNCGKTLKQILGPYAQKIMDMAASGNGAFLTYLEVLVHWVNANAQVLNPELILKTEYVGIYPKADKSFTSYYYENPYRAAQLRLRSLTCGLERLQSSIVNEMAGSNIKSTIANVASVPVTIGMPLSRSGFTSPVPFLNSAMIGGDVYDIDTQLATLNKDYGSGLFESIYKAILGTMGNIPDKKISLASATQSGIEKKLSEFKEVEGAMRKKLAELIERNKLYQASHGYVNPFTNNITKGELGDPQFAALLDKHSNLMNLSSAYNRKANNLISLFTAISNAVLGKLNTANGISTNTSGLQRPLSANYDAKYDSRSAKKN